MPRGREILKGAWETGDAEAMAAAMRFFREAHQDDLLQHAPVPRTEQEEYRSWSRRFATWLYGTEHIPVRYSVDYDGIDIRKLSPGTRGIVLLRCTSRWTMPTSGRLSSISRRRT